MSAAVHSFCGDCGPNVMVDEDGCCAACGCWAMGSELKSIAPSTEVKDLKRRIRLARKDIAMVGWDDGGAVERLRDVLDLRKPLKRGRR